jgi:hypothetical protein
MKKFWQWKSNKVLNSENVETEERVLVLNGTIADESWYGDEVTPKIFRDELMAGDGDITVWICSPGGDCIAASQIYTMLMEYKGKVTVKIDGIAASAASVIAMAGGKVLMSPNCSLDSSYRQPRINYGTYLVGNKSFPYYPGANYKYFTLKNMFPDAIKIADNRILTLHDLKYCVCDLNTQTVLHTIPYDVLNSTANVFTWGQEEITNAINLFLKTV